MQPKFWRSQKNVLVLVSFAKNCGSGIDLRHIHFGQDKTKSVLFVTYHKLWHAKSLNIVYNGIEIKQHSKVKYLGYILYESLSGKSTAFNVIDNKVNSRFRFLHWQDRFLAPHLHTFMYCTDTTSFWLCLLRLRLQVTQNKCMRFCLQLEKMSRICAKDFLELKWLNVYDRYLQFIVSDIFKFYNNQCPDYFNEVIWPVYNSLSTDGPLSVMLLFFYVALFPYCTITMLHFFVQ